MVSLTVAAMSAIIAAPGGPIILVPEDYATIAEAAAAIVVPQFQVIDVAPGTYDVGFVNLGGAAIRGRTGNASDVVLTNGQLENANATALTLKVSLSGTAASSVLDNCYFLGCLGTDCLVKGGAGNGGFVGSLLTPHPQGTKYVTISLTECEVQYQGNTFGVGSMVAIDTRFVGTPVATYTSRGSHYRGCYFVDSPSHGLEVHLTHSQKIVNCTFVGNAGPDILAFGGENNGLQAINTIASFEGVDPTVNFAALYCMEADETIAADGSLLPGSPAIGAGNPHVGLSGGYGCPWNIGADQTDSPTGRDCVPADVNGDGAVNGADLGFLLAVWGQPSNAADIVVNGIVNGGDLGALLANWTG